MSDARGRAGEVLWFATLADLEAIIWRLNDAKRPETRARRLADCIDMLRRGERLHE